MFWKITIPLIRPILVYVMITSMIGRMSGMVIFQNIWFGVQPSSRCV